MLGCDKDKIFQLLVAFANNLIDSQDRLKRYVYSSDMKAINDLTHEIKATTEIYGSKCLFKQHPVLNVRQITSR